MRARQVDTLYIHNIDLENYLRSLGIDLQSYIQSGNGPAERTQGARDLYSAAGDGKGVVEAFALNCTINIPWAFTGKRQ